MSFVYRIKGLRGIFLFIQNLIFNFKYFKKFGNKIKVYGFPIISLKVNSKIQIGKNGTFISDSFFSEPGINHPVIIRLLSEKSELSIGNNFGISGGGICVQTKVTIGNDVMLGANAFISDTDFHPLKPENRRFSNESISSAEIIIEDNVFIGMNCIILKGATIGKNSVIGAGSIVSGNIPANCIAAGIPAKVIKLIEN